MRKNEYARNVPLKERIPFIIFLSIITLAAVALLVYSIVIFVGIIWLNNYKMEFYSPPFDDYVELSYYSANRGELLGKSDLHHTCYELDGLPLESYLLVDEARGFTTVSHEDIVVMSKESAEPIFRYSVKKIELQDGEQTLMITDRTVIDGILEQVRSDEAVIRENVSFAKNTTMYFDLPCELTFECIIIEEGGKVLLLCYDAISYDWYEYDVTEQLSHLL